MDTTREEGEISDDDDDIDVFRPFSHNAKPSNRRNNRTNRPNDNDTSLSPYRVLRRPVNVPSHSWDRINTNYVDNRQHENYTDVRRPEYIRNRRPSENNVWSNAWKDSHLPSETHNYHYGYLAQYRRHEAPVNNSNQFQSSRHLYEDFRIQRARSKDKEETPVKLSVTEPHKEIPRPSPGCILAFEM